MSTVKGSYSVTELVEKQKKLNEKTKKLKGHGKAVRDLAGSLIHPITPIPDAVAFFAQCQDQP